MLMTVRMTTEARVAALQKFTFRAAGVLLHLGFVNEAVLVLIAGLLLVALVSL